MKLKIFFFLLVSIAVVVPSTKSYKKILKKMNFNDIDLSRSNYSITRTEIEEFYNEDFEEQSHGWELNSWFRSSDNSSSGIYSIKDPWEQNSNAGQVYSVISPEIEIVDTFGGEMIQYGFDLWCDIPDYDGDGDSYLEDYYVVSANIPDSTGWQLVTDGASSYYWCGNQEIGGYMDGWVQFLDTPSISLPNTEIQMSANMEWYIENQEAAEVEGTCVDGWDQANVQISTDDGESFSVINGSDPYDFSCGYGSVYNGFEGMPGWGGIRDWHTVTFDLTEYAGQEVVLRFGFYSDPEWSAIDDPSLTGFKVDDITISSVVDNEEVAIFFDNAASNNYMEPKGTLWIEQFYDYCDSDRPGHMNWMEYKPGYAFNGNSLLDITDHRGGSIQFKVDVWYDGDSNGSGNEGIFIDNWKIYKATNESYPYPDNFSVSYDELESNEESDGLNVVSMVWDDLNESGEFQVNYDGGDSSDWDYFILDDLQIDCDDECDYYSGSQYLVAGQSEVNQISLFNHQDSEASVKIAGFNSIADIYNHEPIYEKEVQLVANGWNNIEVEGWEFDGPFIIARSFSNEQSVPIDVSSVSGASHGYILIDNYWIDLGYLNAQLEIPLPYGEIGIRINVNKDGNNGILYNIHRGLAEDVAMSDLLQNNLDNFQQIGSNIGVSYFYDSSSSFDFGNNYIYRLVASYPDGEIAISPSTYFIYTSNPYFMEYSHDDGSAESFTVNDSGHRYAVNFSFSEVDVLKEVIWYEFSETLAEVNPKYLFILKKNNDGTMSYVLNDKVITTTNVTGWHRKEFALTCDNSDGDCIEINEEIELTGEMLFGIKTFSSSNKIGIDQSSNSGNSYYIVQDGSPNAQNDWGECSNDNESCSGNYMIRVTGSHVTATYCDYCGICDNDPSNDNQTCSQDCSGQWSGSLITDECGVCGGGSQSCSDCNGDPFGEAYFDNCNICVGGATGANACSQDCGGQWGGDLVLDICGICGGASVSIDECSLCESDQEWDCNGDCDGNAVVDECGVCCGGDTGNECGTCIGCMDPEADDLYDSAYTVPCDWSNSQDSCESLGWEMLYDGTFKNNNQIVSSSVGCCCFYLGIDDLLIPENFGFDSIYPNPFNPTLNYEFSIPSPSDIKIVIYNLNGREVYSNDMGYTMPGRYNQTWDGSLLPAGIYIISILSDNDIDSRKIVLIK